MVLLYTISINQHESYSNSKPLQLGRLGYDIDIPWKSSELYPYMEAFQFHVWTCRDCALKKFYGLMPIIPVMLLPATIDPLHAA